MPRYLGQHFLADEQILQQIVDAVSDMIEKKGVDTLWEIGPGQGALTKHIYKLCSRFLCFEKDEMMKKYLGQFLQPEQIVWGDILENKQASEQSYVIVGNLPYYITSPIFRSCFTKEERPEGGVFLIQKEVADKMQTNARKKSYLRRLLNNEYDIEYLFTVPPTAFDPSPKVDSAVVSFSYTGKKHITDVALLTGFLDQVSGMKRKTLGKIQKILEKKGQIISLPEKYLSKRLEELGWDEMKEILYTKGQCGSV